MMDRETEKIQTYFTPEEIEQTDNQALKDFYQSIQEKITDPEYPCVGAKAAVNSGQHRIGWYGRMASPETTRQLAIDLEKYSTETYAAESEYMTLIAIFADEPQGEPEFERKLWAQLQQLHDSEKDLQNWDPEVSHDPKNPDFSFSFNGNAFFIVGLHQQASRKARQFPFTAMAFNLHRQFEQLREKGVYDNMKKVIREREIEYSGSINPMLNDFGQGLEAPQYSGRHVDDSWKCPFLHGGSTQK